MESTIIKAHPRQGKGTRVARRERAEGMVPVVIYGHGETPENYLVRLHDLQMEISHGAHTLSLELNGKTTQYLIRDVQFDALGDYPLHVDLLRVSLDERITCQVPVEVRGVPKGVGAGGVMDQRLMSIEVECLAIEIPDKITPLVSELDIDDALFVRDLEMPEGVLAMTPGDEIVVAVRVLAEEIEEEPAEAEGAAQPEVIGRVKEEEEGSD